MQTQMETMGSEEESENEQSLLDSIQVENEERYDYRQFLRKFAVLREEMQTDPDSFDQAFYTYGLSLYGICSYRTFGDQRGAKDRAICYCH